MTLTPVAEVWRAQVVAAEIPIPCCPLEQRPCPNLEEAKYSPKTMGTCLISIPGPLSSTLISILSVFLRDPFPCFSITTLIFGKMPFSSQASIALSKASFNVVKTAFVGDEKPTCCKFLAKYSAVLLEVIFELVLAIFNPNLFL